ncbi:MAG TPA: chemotaxis response regulator protein-glutamate methylesterase [Gemmatimonadaceae bacterium]|nr:chemotaxis response regulator protein-glutamate methylesterase [Gemmatimonadaceae bacterium]
MTRMLKVLVVDDSAFVRKVVTQMLARSPFIEVVGMARDGADALAQVERLRPDVITLDLVMPGMGGVEFLREQMKRRPIPVVVCSITHESGAVALEALEAGAVDFVQKPTALATDRIFEIADELVAKVKVAAHVEFGMRAQPAATVPIAPAEQKAPSAPRALPRALATPELIVIGISTGGPQALREMIPRLPAEFPVPIAIVLHMPIGYTRMYAQRLNDVASLRVAEAGEGDSLDPGSVYIAPAGRHLHVGRDDAGRLCVHLDVKPLDTPHRPAVDVLFETAADTCGERVLGIVMTGMGSDGLRGATHIKRRGGMILTEAESSCVVYGMPRAVDEADLSDAHVSLGEMAGRMMEVVGWQSSS